MSAPNLRFIQVQPATDYYAWQVEVNIHNAMNVQGQNPNFIDVVAAYDQNGVPDSWLKLQTKYPYVRFFFYRDTRENNKYPPSIQPHTLAKHFKVYPELKDEVIFYHDCDFVFTKKFDFKPYLYGPVWYMSDCRGYLGPEYVESKGYGLLDMMCEVIGICSCTVRKHKENTGGAQKLIKNVTHEYWEAVERDSIKLYDWLQKNKHKYTPEDGNEIQIWTASMWAELWNAWKTGKEVYTPEAFNFTWATDNVVKWDMNAFFHNAGVTDTKHGMFYKAAYTKELPYGVQLELDENRCSKKYFDMVQEVGAKSVLI
jgi:hypothetical protein